MANIESLGVGSGLLTADLVDQIIAAERKPTELRLDRRQAEVEAKITAYGEIRSALDKVQSAASSLSSGALIRKTTVTSSDSSALSATTSSTAEPGNYRIAVDEVASSHTLASKAYASVNDTVGTGSLTFSFGTTEYDEGSGDYTGFEQDAGRASFTIDITSGNNTLAGLRDTINKDVEGVTANLVFDGTGYRLLLASEETGKNNSLEIVATGDAGLQSLAYNASQNDPDNNMQETQRGSDAVIRVNGLEVTSASNQINEVIRGVTLNVNQETTGTINLNVARSTGEVADKMEAFVAAYNEFKFIYDEVNKFNPDNNEGGLLLGDSALRSTYSQVRSGLNAIVENLVGANFRSLADVGLQTDQTKGFELQFNRSKFEQALTANAEAMSGLLATQQVVSDSQVRYVTQSAKTQPGEYDVVIDKAATQAVWQGLKTDALSFASPVQIGGSNDSFSLSLDGTLRAVDLQQGSYANGDDLALMLQTSINSAFNGTGRTATVNFDPVEQKFSLTSSSFGSASSLNITQVDPTISQTLGLAPGGTGGVSGQNFSSLNDAGFAASTLPGSLSVEPESGIDFSTNGVVFDLTVAGTAADGTYAINLDEDWSDVLNTEGEVATERDRNDVLTYIQSELNSAGLNGVVTAEFNSANRLIFRTEPAAGSQSITVDNVVLAGADRLGLQTGTSNSGYTLSSDAELVVGFSNRLSEGTSGLITVPAGTYETPEDLAQAIQDQINADANVQAGAAGAETTKGSRALGSNVDFAASPTEIELTLNGTDYTLRVDADDMTGTSTLDSIQQAIANTPGLAGNLEASLDSGGLVLSTVATGSAQLLDITKDGQGATTAAGSQDLSTGIDFSADPTSFTLTVDGVAIDVTVDTDATTGTNDAQSNLAAVQQALDTALTEANGGGEFQAGDVLARLDDNNQLFFETRSKLGEPTLATFGSDASIEMSDVQGTSLGLANQGPLFNGADEFGLSLGQYQGFDSQAEVLYQQNEAGNGGFSISFGNDTRVTIEGLNLTSAAQLGFSINDGELPDAVTGVDVEGSINGVQATGRGQLLTASEGNQAATNGYLLGGPGADFTAPIVIDSTNRTMEIVVDGIASGEIELTEGVYTTGNALANELKRAINADPALASANKAVDVQYDPDTAIFGIFSVTRGSDSTVRISGIDTNAIDIFGFTTSTQGVKGKEASGERDPAAGLVLRVSGTATGDRGSVTLIEGIFSRLDKSLDDLMSSNGLLGNRETSLERDLDNLAEDRQRLDARLEAQEQRLKAKFLFNDKIISQLNTTEDFLVQQFEIMAAGASGKK